MLAVTDFVRAAILILLAVLLPTVPLTMVLSRRPRGGGETLASGRSTSTPFTLISIVGTGIAAFALLALGIVAAGQWIAGGGSGSGEPVQPVEPAGGQATVETNPLPGRSDPTRGKAVFASSGCGSCHRLADSGSKGNVGPDLDEDAPDFTKVVDCVTRGPGDMPSFVGKLTSAEIRDLASYVSSVDGSQSR